MEKLRVGVAGAGHLGKHHIKQLADLENVELIGFYDSNKTIANNVSNEFSLKSFESFRDLLSASEAVSIAVTTAAHFKTAAEALKNGKHVFIEKPITADVSEAETLVDLAKNRNLILQVGHIERFNPAILAIEKYIDNPMFFQTDRLAQFNPRGTDVAVVLDLMIHDIDLILSFIPGEVKDVKASGVAVVSDTLDIANARIEFENGAVANVTASRISQKKMRKMRIFQRDAYLSVDFVTSSPEVYRLKQNGSVPDFPHINFGEIGVGERKKQIIYEQPEAPEVNALRYELSMFADAVLTDRQPVVTGEAALRALRIAKLIENKITEAKT